MFRAHSVSAFVAIAAVTAVVAVAGLRADGQRGRGRGGIQLMTLTAAGWPDGGMMPARHTQLGGEVSPALSWTGVPDGTVSFVVLVQDLDVVAGDGTGQLHWLVWNIPGTATALPEGVPQGAEVADGMRQISVTGPSYRGPAAAPTDPAHHYAFELYALDAEIAVRPTPASPAETRAAVMAAMAGHVRGKATYLGRHK
jgi:Raf kinase inhibitor-like YbhB/YbcL family protein